MSVLATADEAQRNVELLDYQDDFVFSDARYLLNSGGVGSGKTFATIHRTLRLAIDYPGIFILLTGSNLPSLRDTILRDWIDLVPSDFIRSHNKTTNLFELHNGSSVLFRSFDDPNKLKSYTLGAIGIIEMTDVSEELFKMARTRLRQPNMPGCLYGDTNPGSFHSWVYKSFIEKPVPDSEVIYSKTVDNDHLPAAYVNDLMSMKETNKAYFQKMVEGRWGALEGLIFELPTDQRINTSDIECDRHIAGLDFGFQNPTALAVIGQEGEKSYVLDELYSYRMTSAEIIEKVAAYDDKYRFDAIYCDSSRPEIIEDLKNAGLPAVKANKQVFDGIMWVKSQIAQKLLYVGDHCTYTLREFDSYIWDKSVTVKEVPLKANDHIMDAVRYALYSSRTDAHSFDVIGF